MKTLTGKINRERGRQRHKEKKIIDSLTIKSHQMSWWKILKNAIYGEAWPPVLTDMAHDNDD